MLRSLFKSRPSRATAETLYALAADQARTPAFYTRLGVADRIDAHREQLALVSRQTHFSLISRVLKRIESQYTENLSVDQLAAEANMSVSAFHHNFKSVTSTSPLQYLKTYRLHKARMLMIHDGMKASAAAMRVGYESASQFSREFKRYFGMTPGEDAARIRTIQGM